MAAKTLDELRLEFALFDDLPLEIRRMIQNADMISSDIVTATHDALRKKRFTKDQVLVILQQHLTFTKFTR
jgi:hypothetical protein